MNRSNLGKTSSAALLLGGMIMAASAMADPQQGGSGPGYGMGSGMMGSYGSGWMGGYGGIGLPVLLVIVVVGLVAWFVAKKRK